MVTRPLTLAEIAHLPAVTYLVPPGGRWGWAGPRPTTSPAGQFLCPLIRAGKTWLVPTAGLLVVLGLPVPGTGSPASPDSGPP